MMPADELAAIQARVDAATRGPWEAVYDGDWQVEEVYDHGGTMNPPQIAYQAQYYHENTPNNMRFMAAARTDIPALLAERDALVAENARLRAGIAGLRVDHISYWTACDDYGRPSPPASGKYCDCGADAHNAKVDALLKGDT